MFKALMGIDQAHDFVDYDTSLRGGWIAALILLIAAVALTGYLYYNERQSSRGRRMVMAACQGGALLLLAVLLLQPVLELQLAKPYKRTMLVLVDTSRSMAIADQRTSAEDVIEAARVMGRVGFEESLVGPEIEAARSKLGLISRMDLARAALSHEELDLLNKLGEKYQVRCFSFDDKLAAEGDAASSSSAIDAFQARGDTSQVGSAIQDAVGRFAGQPIAGVVVFSDFAWVKGQDPSRVARALSKQGIPVYTVPIGLPTPPDVRLRRVMAPEVVFKGDRVPVLVQIDAHGYAGKSVDLTLSLDGERVTSQQVLLKEGVQFEELMFLPEQTKGVAELVFEVTPLSGETTKANNTSTHKVTIIDDKIKVLYVEGMPRWEYRYLRWVLLRDPRLDVTFYMTEGDPSLAATSSRHISRFPQDPKDVLKYDLIIIGDVRSSKFSTEQLENIERLVKETGGSLLMVAGPVGSPASYRDTPIENMLPVNLGSGQWEGVASDVHPVVTAAGRASAVATLGLDLESSDRVWSKVKPMNVLPQLGGAKPGATVLLGLPKLSDQERDYPLVAWHRYGNGKSLFVATEDLWRMRLEVGDRHHARFWGQTIQFLTLSRLLGQNKQITLETDRSSYSTGEQVRLFANVMTESFEPVLGDRYTVVIERDGSGDSAVEVELADVPDSPGLYAGVYVAQENGSFAVRPRAQDAGVSNEVKFEVATLALEDRETAMQLAVSNEIATLSGGKRVPLGQLQTLPSAFGEEKPRKATFRVERELWDVPVIFVMLLVLCGIEWYLRRRDNLV